MMASMRSIAPEVAETVMDSSGAVVDAVEIVEVVVTSEVMRVVIEAVAVAVLEVEGHLVVVDKRNRRLHHRSCICPFYDVSCDLLSFKLLLWIVICDVVVGASQLAFVLSACPARLRPLFKTA